MMVGQTPQLYSILYNYICVQVPGPVLLQVENSVQIQGSGLVCPNSTCVLDYLVLYPITIHPVIQYNPLGS